MAVFAFKRSKTLRLMAAVYLLCLILVTAHFVNYVRIVKSVVHKAVHDPVLLEQADAEEIPSILHQTWKDETIPPVWAASVARCRRVNANMTYHMWTDARLEALISAEYAWFLPTYRGFAHDIQRVDAARLFVLHRHGGVYQDMDVTCRRPWSSIVANYSRTWSRAGCVLFETSPWGVTNDIIVARARDPFIAHLLERMRDSHRAGYFIQYLTVMLTTGPMFVTNELIGWRRAGVAVMGVKDKNLRFGNLRGGTWHNATGRWIYYLYGKKHYVTTATLMLGVCGFLLYIIKKNRKKSSVILLKAKYENVLNVINNNKQSF